MMCLCFSAQAIENDSGLHASDAARGVDLQNTVHVFRKIEDDGGVAALPGERCAAATRQERSSVFAAQGNCGNHIFGIARDGNSDWNLTIVRAVGGIQGAATGVKTDFSAKMAAESGFERRGIELRGMG
jgi:hypothetical protein